MSKRKNRIPKGFKAFRMLDGDEVLVHTRTQRCTHILLNADGTIFTGRHLSEVAECGWALSALSQHEQILHQIVE